MTYYLFVWSLTFALPGPIGHPLTFYDWRNVAAFYDQKGCEKAATTLGYTDKNKWRCVRNDGRQQ